MDIQDEQDELGSGIQFGEIIRKMRLLADRHSTIASLEESHRFNLWKFRFFATKPYRRDPSLAAGFAKAESGGQANERSVLWLAKYLTIRSSRLRDLMNLLHSIDPVHHEKPLARFEQTQANLKRSIEPLHCVIVYRDDDSAHPYKLVGLYEDGKNILNL